MKLSSVVMVFALALAGCDKPKVVSGQTYTDEERAIAATMVDMSEYDCEVFYKMAAGLTEYLKNTNVKVSTAAINKQIHPAVQTDYNYKKVPAFTAKVKEFMDARGYLTPKTIVELVADENTEVAESKVIEDYTVLANAAKCAIESKK